MTSAASGGATPRLVYCHCAYAKVIPGEVRDEVLARLSRSGQAFDAVADLCEMSARRDPALRRLAAAAPARIIACFPRAVMGLFEAADVPVEAERIDVLNMRTQSAKTILEQALAPADGRGEA